MRWIKISIHTNETALGAVAALMESHGTGGTLFEDGPRAIGYLPADDRFETKLDNLRGELAKMPEVGLDPAPAGITLTFVDDDDWATAWREHYKPIRISDRLTIAPTWCAYEGAPGELVIRLDPGMAFGTGGHPTTRICLRALQEIVRGGETVADVGTGSAVLAIGAALLGASRVDASDADPVAVKVARANVEESGLSEIISVREADRLEGAGNDYDIVVANILPNVVRGLAPAAFRALRPGGAYLVSGLTLPHEPDVTEAIEDAGFTMEGRWEEDQWAALCGRKPSGD
ncbi:MAG TPA: 50S ribosomal protein L11 methyltransferase [Armatimonadota bacterium]|jgi:ribosomal protein L11 methyltransferase